MSTTNEPQPQVQTNPTLVNFCDPSLFDYREQDLELFERQFASFVPPNSFDSHAHIYDVRHVLTADEDNQSARPEIDHAYLVESMRRWMGDHVVTDGLYFPFPRKNVDSHTANEFLAKALSNSPGSRGLMLARPQDDPSEAEAALDRHSFAGFKVYHVYAEREETFHAECDEFLPQWVWELADQRGLAIMLHMVLPQALRDHRNQQYIIENCLRFPNARLILAHAARGFNAVDTVLGIDSLRGLPNVYFDTSAICEAAAFEAIIKACGPSRLMYGSDFPVSESRGRSFNFGDGFCWLYEHNWHQIGAPTHGKPLLIGHESLAALQLACRNLGLVDRDVERIFCHTAREILGVEKLGVEKPIELESHGGVDGRSRYSEAKQLIPGGVQLLSKRPEMFAPEVWPAYFEEASGCEIVDYDGKRFLDMSYCGILSCVLGFADPDVNRAVIRRVTLGNMATQQTADDVRLAELLTDIHPWADQARFARSGGESMTIAVRIARAATGRDKIALCGYHGWHDWYVAANLHDVNEQLEPDKQLEPADKQLELDKHLLPGIEPIGVPSQLAGTTLTFTYNQLDELKELIQQHGGEIAAIVMEPTRSIDPEPGFLEGVRQIADESGAVLVFDEISSGWRQCLGGAHRLYGTDPDMAVFAKALGNGYAMGAIIGRQATMQAAQSSFISSTYWTEGVGPAAAVAAVEKMTRCDIPAHLKRLGAMVQAGWKDSATRHALPVRVQGRLVAPSFAFDHPLRLELMTLFTTYMIDMGILACGNCAMTFAHQEHHVARYLRSVDDAFAQLARDLREDTVVSNLRGPVRHTGFRRLVN